MKRLKPYLAMDNVDELWAHHTRVMAELLLLSGVLALFGLAFWLTTDSDDDNGGGGMMQPVLVPVRVQRRR